jgi:hypothetical protein
LASPYPAPQSIGKVAHQEADAQGKSSIASDFVGRIVMSTKGGSYDVACPAGSPPSCVFGYYRALAGRITLPYKVKATKGGQKKIVNRSFVMGFFVNDLPMPCNDAQPPPCQALADADNAFNTLFAELPRAAIRDALKTW